jgi:energy-coupling factor transporter ATP-binding protein EcfA2
VAIARAIVTEPAVLLADEPTGNLDTQRSHEIMDLLWRLNRDQGITVLMVTHEPDMAAYARRIVRFVDGRSPRHPTRTPGPAHPRRCRAHASPQRGRLMLLNTLLLALRSIRRNLLRSFLTILGIVIGVSAVITMVTLGNGATRVGAEPDLQPGHQPAAGAPRPAHGALAAAAGAPPPSRTPTPRPSPADRRHAGRGARGAHRRHRGGQRAQLDHQRHRQHQRWLDRQLEAGSGPQLRDDELRAGAAVCLIGETVRRELFGTRGP